MESKLSPQFLVLLSLSLSLLGVFVPATTTDMYVAVGGDIILTPKYNGIMYRLTWYHGYNYVVDWDGGTPKYYSKFKNRTTLDTRTTHLTITGVDGNYSGEYKLEINVQDYNEKYNVHVINRVAKPTIEFDTSLCNSDSISCNFTCKATSLEEAQPVTYWWKIDDGDWMELNETLTLSNEILYNSLKIICLVKNPVSEEESEPVENKMHKKDHTAIIAGSVGGIVIAVVIVVVVIVIWKKDAIKNVFVHQAHQSVPTEEENEMFTIAPNCSNQELNLGVTYKKKSCWN